AEIPGVMHMAVEPLPTMREDGEMWAATGHPVNPDRLTMAMGVQGSTFSDHGMNWDNSAKPCRKPRRRHKPAMSRLGREFRSAPAYHADL
ncbi:hypothetical protein EN856_38520, partial [Mesorhizobium sp. M8A.F.Ca.ET.213.01.1.1]